MGTALLGGYSSGILPDPAFPRFLPRRRGGLKTRAPLSTLWRGRLRVIQRTETSAQRPNSRALCGCRAVHAAAQHRACHTGSPSPGVRASSHPSCPYRRIAKWCWWLGYRSGMSVLRRGCEVVTSQSGDERVGLSAPRFLHEVAIIAGQPAEPVDHRLLALLPRQAVDDGKPHRAAEHGALMLVPARIEHLIIRSRKVGITMGVVWREESGRSPRCAAKQEGGWRQEGRGGTG